MDTSTRTSIIGTSMLLMAAAIVMLTFVFRGPLWRPSLGQPLPKSGAASEETSSRRIAASPFQATVAPSTTSATADSTARAADRKHKADASPAPVDNKQQAQPSSTTSSTNERSSQPLPAFRDADPWAATKCVYALDLGLSQPPRWKIENGCDTPVGVSFYSEGSMILPAPAQRPVALDEQTVRAGVRYVACYVATAKAISLIGAPSEERSTPAWREQFEAARVNDACLLRLQGGNSVP